MRLELTVMLPDRPGELLKVLEVLAGEGGNVVSIVHEREKVVEGVVPVDLVVELPSTSSPLRVKELLEAKDVMIMKFEEAVEKARVTVVAVGKTDTSILSEFDKEVKVVGFEGETRPESGGALKITFEGPLSALESTLAKVKEAVEKEGGLLILPIEEAKK